MNCLICGKFFKRLSKHIQESHPDEHDKQLNLIISLRRDGKSISEISQHPGVIYNNRMSIYRILEKAASQRRVINLSSDRTLHGDLRDIFSLSADHRDRCFSFAESAGFEIDSTTGIISHGCVRMVVVPLRCELSKYQTIAETFVKSGNSRLFIYADELLNKPDLIISMVKIRSGEVSRRIFARKCSISDVSLPVAKKFFDENHISGHVRGKLYIGLAFDSELVACISTRHPFISKYGDSVEIARYASLIGCSVVGGFSKLLKAVKSRNLDKSNILSYCDLRYGTGNVYEKTGFTYIGNTNRDYCYSDGERRFNRFRFRAQDGKSEHQVALECGVFTLWGPGSLRYLSDCHPQLVSD